MTIKIKPIVENKFWIIENDDGERIGTCAANKDKISYRVGNTSEDFPSFNDMVKEKQVEVSRRYTTPKTTEVSLDKSVYGYPTNHTPHNQIWNVQMRLPLYTKTNKSSSYHCAGYYIIKFDRTWCKSYTPKLITLQRYPYQGPFMDKTEQTTALRTALETT
jgi:hypothetical protein